MTPAEFRAAGRAEVERYGGRIIEGDVVAAVPGFEVTLADGSTHRARSGRPERRTAASA